jgi:SNF2-related domain/Helicase conserved C-terminal domain
LFLIQPRTLGTMVSDATYQRGLAAYRNQQVLECRASPTGSQAWQIQGQVLGSDRHEIYEQDITLEVDAQGQITFFSGECSCAVGRNCKHTVALALKAAYRTLQPGFRPDVSNMPATQAAAAPPPSPGERELQLAHHKVNQWLDLFGDHASENSVQEQHPRGRTGAADQVVYMLGPVTRGELQQLQLEFGRSRLLQSGRWAKVKQSSYFDPHGVTTQDLDIVRLIQSMTQGATYYSSYNNHGAIVCGASGALALQLAAATGRLFSLSEPKVLGQPLAWGAPRTINWHWNEVTRTHSPEPLWALRSQLADAGAGAGANEKAQWFANSPPLYLDHESGSCGPVEVPGMSAEHLGLLLKAPPIPQSDFARHETTLLRQLAGLPLPPVLKPPTVVQGVQPVAHLHIAPVAAQHVPNLGLLRAELRFNYAGHTLPENHGRTPVLLDDATQQDPSAASRRVLVHRDLDAERQVQQALANLGLVGNHHGHFHLMNPGHSQQRWLVWADADFAPLAETGAVLHLDPSLAQWITRADQFDVELAAGGSGEDLAGGDDSQSPWFDLSLGFELNGQRHNILPLLPTLIEQLGLSDTAAQADNMALPEWVYLPQADGTYLRLPTAPLRPWLQALLDLVGERSPRDLSADTLRLSRLEALRMGAALGEGLTWQGASSLREMVRQLGGHSSLPEVTLPAGLQAELRPYQEHGLQWLQFLRTHGLAGILADDMGLGKTLQTLAHLLIEKTAGRLDRPALIVAPVSVISNWQREAGRFTPELRTLVLHGQDRHEAATSMAEYDVVIAPYSLLQRDRERWLAQPWHVVVLDEAQNIKNAATQASQVVSELNARHRLCLSGTPIENHLGELWSLFHFLMPGFLSSQARFKQLFRTPIEKHGDSERLQQLRRRVTPFMLRRTKGEVATDLPEKQEIISTVELGDKQANLYETIRLTTEKTVREALSSKGLAKSQIQILDALLKLRQVCCDPRLVPLAAAKKIKQSAKLEQLMALLPELISQGRRVLLFSQFTSMLELIEEALRKEGIPWVKLTGQSQKRDQLITKFTSGEVPLFLISLKAGGVGLNLTQADTVIHYDPWWNPAVENQATDRAHRIGQTEHVFVYKLVAQGTIEERMLALQKRKAALADSMYRDCAARKQPLFTEGDLAELLRPLGG